MTLTRFRQIQYELPAIKVLFGPNSLAERGGRPLVFSKRGGGERGVHSPGHVSSPPPVSRDPSHPSHAGANAVSEPSTAASDLQQKYRQFLDLMPLTLALAGLP